jgi:threonine synthase
MPDLEAMKRDIFSISVSNEEHYKTIKRVYKKLDLMLEPHGAVGWRALEEYNDGNHAEPAVVYETADPGKFPDDIHRALGFTPDIPKGILNQQYLQERTYQLDTPSATDTHGNKRMDASQYKEMREQVAAIRELRE